MSIVAIKAVTVRVASKAVIRFLVPRSSDYHFIVKNGHECIGDADRFFGPLEPTDEVIELDPWMNMYDVLVLCGVFRSKSHARQNWHKTGPEISLGYSEHRGIGHLRKNIFILNPIANAECVCNES